MRPIHSSRNLRASALPGILSRFATFVPIVDQRVHAQRGVKALVRYARSPRHTFDFDRVERIVRHDDVRHVRDIETRW